MSRKLDELKAKWYAKLKNSGFNDIEQDEDNLKEWENYKFKLAHKSGRYESLESYYRLAGQFLYDHKFENAFEKKVWAAHAEGKTVREVTQKLIESGVKTYKREVHETIQKLVKIMTGKLKS